MENREILLKLAQATMPFGRYEGRNLLDLPEEYLAWFAREGYPPGELGALMALAAEIKGNGLESLLDPLRSRRS